MTSTKFSLKTLEDIFKINLIIGLNAYFPIIIIVIGLLENVEGNLKFPLGISLLLLCIFTTIICFFYFKFFNLRYNYLFIFLFFYLFIFLFTVFYLDLYRVEENIQRIQNPSYSYGLHYIMLGILTVIVVIPGTILYFRTNRKVLSLINKDINTNNNFSIFIIYGVIEYVILNIGGLIRLFKLQLFLGFLFLSVLLIYFILYQKLQKWILDNFRTFLYVNLVLLFLPFILCLIYKIGYFEMVYMWNLKCFSVLVTDEVLSVVGIPIEGQLLFLLSPYQTIVFPLFFNFNAYIIAQKIIETKYPTLDQEKGFESRVRPEFKTEQERKDWYDQNY